jgi:hypothetical protein
VRRSARTHVLQLLRSVLPHRGAGGVPPPAVAPVRRGRGLFLRRSRPRLVQVRVTGDRFRAGPPPANADAVQPKPNHWANVVVRAAATPELTRAARTARTIRARRPTRSAVGPHARAGQGRPRAVGLAQPRRPAGGGGSMRAYGFGFGGCGRSCAGAVSAGLGLAWAARHGRRHAHGQHLLSDHAGMRAPPRDQQLLSLPVDSLHANLRVVTPAADPRHVRRLNHRCSEAADLARLTHVCDLFVRRPVQPVTR